MPDSIEGASATEPEIPIGRKRPVVMLVWKKRIILSQVRRQVEFPHPKLG